MRFFIFPFLFLLTVLHGYAEEEAPTVLVSFAPYRYFVQQIAKDKLKVEVMVPPGASAHTYEPTSKQMIRASKAAIWFRIGEPFEAKAVQALKSASPSMEIVDLRQNIPLLQGACCHHHGHNCGEDLHIWMSPKLAKIQVKTIGEALMAHYPKEKQFFAENLSEFLKRLDDLDEFIAQKLAPLENRYLLVSHPAYGYYCQDYHLTQIPIECEGKDPTGRQMTALLNKTRELHIHYILTQPQYSDKAALLVASQIGAKAISVDPYSENYIESLKQITSIIAENA